MPYYEYKVVPAPEKTPRIRGLKGPERFAQTLETMLCEMGAYGWEYQRAETLPETERGTLGLAAKATVMRTVLIFRRELDEMAPEDASYDAEAAAEAPPAEDGPQNWPTPERRLVADPADRQT